jgi:hypothetical protein
MTKSEIRDLQSRIGQIEKTDTPEWRARAEGEAHMAWIIRHLTQDEQMALSRAIAAYNDDSPNTSEAASAVFLKGEERTGTKPPAAYEEFKKKYMRAEALRNTGRRLTEAEGDELTALNAWLYP